MRLLFDQYDFVSVGYSNEVYHLVDPTDEMAGLEDEHTLCGIVLHISNCVRAYPALFTRRKMLSLYRHLRPCIRCNHIRRKRQH